MAEPSEELMAKLLLLLQQQDKMLQQQDKTKLLLEQSSEAFRRTATGAMSAILSGQRSCRPEKTAPQYGKRVRCVIHQAQIFFRQRPRLWMRCCQRVAQIAHCCEV